MFRAHERSNKVICHIYHSARRGTDCASKVAPPDRRVRRLSEGMSDPHGVTVSNGRSRGPRQLLVDLLCLIAKLLPPPFIT
jgi:hypothetical protein